ncbi:Gfo/Idh/MocA family oxidoreductase [Streptomyces sp. DSM 44915]|uniref:Gfo/Idh/MocA family oxidoreductase n=1 Tax=Streptomyces chisholmiae TaxID=3075540 RepID=A0ABU2JS10_9ACTN|nr:Gfo/Idh/MocA family oxidoreductase [Streptomyces sp. DSM 44915]MDT0267516.1 Gfo/Idh/MocA family oxidoreductase [Streptomyces sp. DSM 44915]
MWIADSRPRPLKAGLIGGGSIAGVHARAIRAAGGVLHGVASSAPDRARSAAQTLDAARWYDHPDELLADDTLDLVHICSPNGTHADYARAALTAGKHVVCEKPLAVSPADAQELAALATARGLVATVPFVYRYHPMAVEARARAAAGALGPLVSVRGGYLQEWRLAYDEDGWWTNPTATGPSRAFGDIGSHLGDLTEFITGDHVRRVSAATRTVRDRSPRGRPLTTEDVAAVTVELAGGAVGTLLVSQMALGRKNHLFIEVSGTEANLLFEQENPNTLWYAARTGGQGAIPRDTPQLSAEAARLSVLPAGHPMGYQDAFNAFVRDTHAAVHGQTSAELPTFHDGAAMVRLTQAVVDSAATGGWTEVAAPPATAPATAATTKEQATHD